MSEKFSTATIAAPATAPGSSALALVRISGPASVNVTAQLFSRGKELQESPPGAVLLGWFLSGEGKKLDQVLLWRFAAPHSYTGEEMVEISCHGSPYILNRILDTLYRKGIRAAEPGEFTRRAFLNGKLDLTRAEAVEALISARTEFSHRHALLHLQGGLERRLEEIRRGIIEIYALVEAELDFSDEEITPTTDEELESRITRQLSALEKLSATWERGRLAAGVQVVLAGAPNTGKSTLMNALLREERVIVNPQAGTTRDAVSAEIDLRGLQVNLWDTAGLRKTDNPVEREGVRRTREIMERADLVLHLESADTPSETLQRQPSDPPLLRVWSKADLSPPPSDWSGPVVSGVTGEGLEDLLEIMYHKLTDDTQALRDEVLVTNARHRQLLLTAAKHLQTVLKELHAGTDRSLLPILLRDAVEAVGLIHGAFSIEEVLDDIFGRFCIGK